MQPANELPFLKASSPAALGEELLKALPNRKARRVFLRQMSRAARRGMGLAFGEYRVGLRKWADRRAAQR